MLLNHPVLQFPHLYHAEITDTCLLELLGEINVGLHLSPQCSAWHLVRTQYTFAIINNHHLPRPPPPPLLDPETGALVLSMHLC